MNKFTGFTNYAYAVVSEGKPLTLAFTREEARGDKAELKSFGYNDVQIVQLVANKVVR